MDKFIENVKNCETIETENGATQYKTSGKALLDLNFAVSSFRNTPALMTPMFNAAYGEDSTLALKWLFYAGDIRKGLGERDLFKTLMRYNIAKFNSNVLNLIPEYTRWDYILPLLDTEYCYDVVNLIRRQYYKDVEAMEKGEPVSLMAKWLPSINTSSKKTRKIAKTLAFLLDWTFSEYRTNLTKLRKYLNVVEVKMTANEWGDIDYSAVPSKANLIYKDAFLRHDEERRNEFFRMLEAGEAKINASVAFPHDIVSKYSHTHYEEDPTLEAMWAALPDYVQGNGSTMVIRDGSGSMYTYIGNSNVQAIDVATALTVYFSERQSGPLKDKFITFSSNPEFVDLSKCNTLKDKLIMLEGYDDCSNTDMAKTLKMLLDASKGLTQDEIPSSLLIVSDMEFDAIPSGNNIFENYAEKFEEAGLKMPKLVFWNVMSRTNGIPVRENEQGVILVSGFSPIVCELVLSTEVDPYKALVKVLNSERYDAVEKAIK